MPYNVPLSNIQAILERSMFHAIRRTLVSYGYLPDINLFTLNTEAGALAWEAALASIKTTKGFAIEVFGHSSTQEKDLKRHPRIVILPNLTMPGALGGIHDMIYEPNGPDVVLSGYSKSKMPSQTADFLYDVVGVYQSAEEGRVVNSMIALSMPRRGFVDVVDPTTGIIAVPAQRFHVELINNKYFDNLEQGTSEVQYMYKLPDIFEIENILVDPNIAAMVEITVEAHPEPEDQDPPSGVTPITQVVT